MKIKRIIRTVISSVLAVCMLADAPALISLASSPGQERNPNNVRYGTVSKDDQNLLWTLFDADYYAKEHPDVVQAYGSDPKKLFTHFVKHGIFEARQCNAGFNVSVYRSCYPDLQQAFNDDIVAYYRHYLNNGIYEGRKYTTMEAAAEDGRAVYGFFSGKALLEARPKIIIIDNSDDSAAKAEAEKKAAEQQSRQEEENRVSEATEKAKQEAEKAQENASSSVPTPKEGYEIVTDYLPTGMTVNTYGYKKNEWTIVSSVDVTFEYENGYVTKQWYKDDSGNQKYYRITNYDSDGNILSDMRNISNLFNGYDGDEYKYDERGNITMHKEWSQGTLLKWQEYTYTYGTNGKPSVVTINKIDPQTGSISTIGYCAYTYDESGKLKTEAFSDTNNYEFEYFSDGTLKQRVHSAGDSFIELLRYEYDNSRNLVKETLYANNPLQIQEEKIYKYGTVYLEVKK